MNPKLSIQKGWFLLGILVVLTYPVHLVLAAELEEMVASSNQSNNNLSKIEYLQSTTTVTVIINLPIIEHDNMTETPVPIITELAEEIPTGTPTPTPIPVQTGSVNIPIVFGAMAIISVIILAWFFIRFLPKRSKS
ncbi:MAG: hypothetical protein JSV42_16035 [Chloroflexota bacterium]|nr:MAG: hypothetical protein JSV42_16035 [Chloroflexota bacterium]